MRVAWTRSVGELLHVNSRKFMIYGHGDDGFCTDVNIVADFSTNVWYGAENEPLVRFLQKRIPMILHYPEPNADSFALALAEYHGVGEDSIFVGNGETELLYMIAQAYRGVETMIFYPSYSEYADSCEKHGHKVKYLHYGAELKPEDGELVIIGNPNNPNGKLMSKQEIAALLQASPNRVVVIDEAFIDFTIGDNSVVDLTVKYDNLIVVRSMTNKYAVPGLRLGYIVACPKLIDKIAVFAYPWRVNALAIETGKFLLQRKDTLSGSLPTIMQRKENLQAAILRIKGYEPKVSDTTFFLVKCAFSVEHLKAWLLEKHGILIRNCSNFKGLSDHYFRLNTLNEKRNAMLVDALEQYSLENR